MPFQLVGASIYTKVMVPSSSYSCDILYQYPIPPKYLKSDLFGPLSICIYTYIYTYAVVYVRVRVCMSMCIHTCIHTYIYMYLFMWDYTQAHPSSIPGCGKLQSPGQRVASRSCFLLRPLSKAARIRRLLRGWFQGVSKGFPMGPCFEGGF